jgi:hypothetical protein
MERPAGSDVHAAPEEQRAPVVRATHLDAVRTALVAWVIAGHALLGYSAVGGWAYDEVREVTFTAPVELVLVALLGPSGLFVIGVFFFVAGLLSERGIARHGAGAYARGRLLRLGLPWAVSALLLWPVSVWVAYRAAGRPGDVWWVLTHREPLLDAGSLWFALVLLLYSLGLAAWRHRAGPPRPGGPLSGAHLAAAVVLVTTASFAVRLVFPARSGQVLDLHLWQWPQCLGLFVLGVLTGRRGWAAHVPDRLRRHCGGVTAAVLALLPVLALLAGVRDVSRDVGPFLGGLHWQALATAAVEAVLVVAGSVWLVGAAEHRHRGAGRRFRLWTRGAYIAFVVQGPVLLLLATALRPLDAPAEVKGPVVAVAALVVCFWLGGRLTRLPGIRRRSASAPS